MRILFDLPSFGATLNNVTLMTISKFCSVDSKGFREKTDTSDNQQEPQSHNNMAEMGPQPKHQVRLTLNG